MPTFGSLPEVWQRFALEHDLPYHDITSLRNFDSIDDLDDRRLMIMTNQFDRALQEDDWPLCEALLCMLLRSDLQPVFGAACECGLGWLANVATKKQAMVTGLLGDPAGSTSRLGRVLAVKLDRMAQARIAAARARGRGLSKEAEPIERKRKRAKE